MGYSNTLSFEKIVRYEVHIRFLIACYVPCGCRIGLLSIKIYCLIGAAVNT